MNTLLDLLKKSAAFLEKKGIEKARLKSELIFAGTLHCKRFNVYLQFDRPLTTEQTDILRERVLRCARHEPVQYIVGETDFRKLTLKCDPRALIPRPETEELVKFVLKKISETRQADVHVNVLDLGTGTGAIALSLAAEREKTFVCAVDKSADALALARENASTALPQEATSRVKFLQSDWFQNVDGVFDVIVSNPPYLTEDELRTAQPEVREHEPHEALVAADEGIADLEKILRGAGTHLADGGFIAFETGIAQHGRLAEIAHENGFSKTKSMTDLENRPRYFFVER